jgi:DNA-directed RNA polymerase sigma subunit (sigma70/sigma32)
MEELKRRHRGLVMSYVQKYAAASVPRAALEAQAWLLFADAVQAYQPGSSAKFSTFAVYHLMRLDRFTKSNQNVARIPEGQASLIGRYDRTASQLVSDLGREPTSEEVASSMRIPIKRIKTLERMRRRDLFEGGYEGDTEVDAQSAAYNKHLLVDIRSELTPQELSIYDRLIGHNRPQVTDKKRIARELGMSPGRVSQITSGIALKMKPHLAKR